MIIGSALRMRLAKRLIAIRLLTASTFEHTHMFAGGYDKNEGLKSFQKISGKISGLFRTIGSRETNC